MTKKANLRLHLTWAAIALILTSGALALGFVASHNLFETGSLFGFSHTATASVSPCDETNNCSAETGDSSLPAYDLGELRSALIGKTMKEVREKIGEPSSVADNSDVVYWFYSNDRISVYDEDSGTNAAIISIAFSLPDKIVTEVQM